MSLLKRLPACLLIFLLVGCGNKPTIELLSYIGQPSSVIEAKYGKPSNDSSIPEEYVYGASDGIEMLHFWFSEGKCIGLLVQFKGDESTSVDALVRVGLGQNAVSRAANAQTDNASIYLNQEFGGQRLSQVKTLKQEGKYHGVRVEL